MKNTKRLFYKWCQSRGAASPLQAFFCAHIEFKNPPLSFFVLLLTCQWNLFLQCFVYSESKVSFIKKKKKRKKDHSPNCTFPKCPLPNTAISLKSWRDRGPFLCLLERRTATVSRGIYSGYQNIKNNRLKIKWTAQNTQQHNLSHQTWELWVWVAQKYILSCRSRKSRGVTNNINSGSALFKCPVTVNQHERYQDPETEATKWNSAIINFIIYISASSTVTCHNVFSEKGLL